MLLEAVGGFLGSIISGGVTGILGVGVQRYADYKNKELDLKASREKSSLELELRRIDLELIDRESAAKITTANINAENQMNITESNAFQASFSLEPKQFSPTDKLTVGQSWLFVALDCVRGLVRPSLTLYLAAFATYIYFHSIHLIQKEGLTLSIDQGYQLVEQVTQTVLYLFATCTMWYFGSRNKASEYQARKK